MKLGDVLRKERERKQITTAVAATTLGLSQDEYRRFEMGESPAEKWGPLLAEIAIKLSAPTARLLSRTGLSADARDGSCGARIRSQREQRELTVEELAAAVNLSAAELEEIEAGRTELEQSGPLLLAFAEMIDQPVFNLFYPCGLALERLDDYP